MRGSIAGWCVGAVFAVALAGCSGKSASSDDGSAGDAGKASSGGASAGRGGDGAGHAGANGGASLPAAGAGATSGGSSSQGGGAAGSAEVGGSGGVASGGVGGDSAQAGSGTAGAPVCQPKTCMELQACGGSVGDGCGKILNCPPCDCENLTAGPLHSRRAKSEGFAGTVDQYFELYEAPCEDLGDCADACAARGGTETMCAASECIEGLSGEPNHCLPATAWRNFEALRSEGNEPYVDGAELVLVYNPYHDRLIADDFQFSVPEDADITGISVHVRRAADGVDSAVDETVRLIHDGTVGTVDRSKPVKWSAAFEEVTYGGPADDWGRAWTPADVNAPTFGVAFSALYTQTAGNGRAYVDIIRVTVHYRRGCGA